MALGAGTIASSGHGWHRKGEMERSRMGYSGRGASEWGESEMGPTIVH